MRLFKILDNIDGTECGFRRPDLHWNLPEGNLPGEWMPRIETGGEEYELRSEMGLEPGRVYFEAECRGDRLRNGVILAREARLLRHCESWNSATAMLFACDCAEHILHIYDAEYSDGDRLRAILEIARRFARGEACESELHLVQKEYYRMLKERKAFRDKSESGASKAFSVVGWAIMDFISNPSGLLTVWHTAYFAVDLIDYVQLSVVAERKWQNQRLLNYIDGKEV